MGLQTAVGVSVTSHGDSGKTSDGDHDDRHTGRAAGRWRHGRAPAGVTRKAHPEPRPAWCCGLGVAAQAPGKGRGSSGWPGPGRRLGGGCRYTSISAGRGQAFADRDPAGPPAAADCQ